MKKAFLIKLGIIILSVVATAVAVLFGISDIQERSEYVEEMNAATSTLYQSEIGHFQWSAALSRSVYCGDPFNAGNNKETRIGCGIGDSIKQDDSYYADYSKCIFATYTPYLF